MQRFNNKSVSVNYPMEPPEESFIDALNQKTFIDSPNKKIFMADPQLKFCMDDPTKSLCGWPLPNDLNDITQQKNTDSPEQ